MKLIDLLHRWMGGLIGLVLAVLGFTGALLVHRDAWIMLPHAGDPQVQDTGAVADAVAKIMADPAARPESIVFASQNFGLNRLSYADGGGAYADQTGEIVTRWASQWERPELWLFDLHHHLFTGDTGETVAGIAGLCGLFFVVTGAILWWRTRKTFEFRLWPRRMSRPAIVRQHRDLGIVVAPLLLLSIVTGAALIFRPVAALILGPSAPAVVSRALAPPPPREAKLAAHPDWRGMIETARARFPDAELRILSLPRGKSGMISLRTRQQAEWLPNGRSTLWFAADSGVLVDARNAFDLPAQAQGFNLFYPLHAAKVGGLAYRLVMTVSGLAMALLGGLAVWTFWFRGGRRIPAR
ncbi:Uncharacterized iron-regulated membrane protein [Sphingomonas laterariae]|uniref:Uncharacterized iron-regulated membrane protein n=1 Tax=Edaphosphingomonas laterariae TaxID=861865 RepID=A0A239GAK6_9SPHN|nr:PepSY-associated TM helix domain-containing protein [Sphingomonas laterariae]SNS65965.1 Uncharacterized iron-regulated membrane protein [Sphingomonas laterariae]